MKGWDRVQAEAEAQEARKEQSAHFGSVLRPKHIKDAGGAIVVRFLEQGQEVNVFDQHQYNVPDARAKGGSFQHRFTCLKEIDMNAECPGCKVGLPIKPRTAFNLIYRDRPVLRKDKDGKAVKNPDGSYIVEGKQDQVVFFEVANTTANHFRRCDNDFRGLMSRDLVLGLSGDSFQPYTLAPADIDAGPQPMSDADRELAAKKHDLDDIFKPPTLQEAAQIVARYGANSGASTQGQVPSAVPAQQANANPMLAGVPIPAGVSPFAPPKQQG